MSELILYCRAGFESECVQEIQDLAARREVAGFGQAKANQGYVRFTAYDDDLERHLIEQLRFHSLVFTRQWFEILDHFDLAEGDDRVAAILASLAELGDWQFGDLRIEYADTNEGKALNKFARKFMVPLRKALRDSGYLSTKTDNQLPVLHIFLQTGLSGFIGYSLPGNNSPFELGIVRLRQPKAAPSRSTLKLDEAFHVLMTDAERDARVQSGMNAVDLGAAPGGWTYQLVRRGLMVQAVDNGPMDESLMESGQVRHFEEDGFKFRPKRRNITWLVCDMVEKPGRVARLMATWLAEGLASELMFNLKLPMKQRYTEWQRCRQIINQYLAEAGVFYSLRAKHLYHDREEITVYLRRKGRD